MNTITSPASMAITEIEIGDTIQSGYGIGNITDHVVTEIKVYSEYDYYLVVKCADGYTISDTPNGFHYPIIKADPEVHARAIRGAAAFAKAWDRR